MAQFLSIVAGCGTPVPTNLLNSCLINFALSLVTLLCLVHRSNTYSAHVADMCDSGAVHTAAHIIFQDGVERYFISNGHNYWFLNETNEMPDVQSAFTIPYDFLPDVAIVKDTRNCSSGSLSLVLIQMKQILTVESNEAEWRTVEMKIGNWNDNQTGPVSWSQVKEIAHCDLDTKICIPLDRYFETMSFDFKQKLNAAFGTIGQTAYFIQGQNLFKVIYNTPCISNSRVEVISYPPTKISTDITAAVWIKQLNSSTVVLFDNDVHLILNLNTTVDNFSKFDDQQLDVAKWKENANHFFKQCPLVDSTFSFLLMDVFSNSKKHYMKKRIILFTSAIIMICLVLLVICLIVFNTIRKSRSAKRKSHSINESNEEKLIEEPNKTQINAVKEEQQKTLLQTSC